MVHGPLTERIIAAYETLGPQLQTAARFVLEKPEDVALLTMRDQARRAGVQPHTMTRLAQRLGLAGYDGVRSLYAAAIREGALDFSGKADAQVARQEAQGERALAAEIIASVGAQVARLSEAESLDRLVAAAQILGGAHRVYCLALRSCHPVAAQVAYVLSFLGERAVLLDAGAGTGLDRIRSAGARDVVLAASVEPYTRATVETAQYAAAQGVPVVAITDSPVSPLAVLAREVILVPTDSPSFFHTVAPAFVVGEVLAALVAGGGGRTSLDAIRRSESQLTAFGVHWTARTPPRSPRRHA